MFRASTVPIIRSYLLYTWQLVCFMQVMWPLPRRVRLEPDSPRQRPHNLLETYQLPRVQQITPDDGHRRCPKHVEFRDKIKNLDTRCILLVIYTKIITMHGHLNIKYPKYYCMCGCYRTPNTSYVWNIISNISTRQSISQLFTNLWLRRNMTHVRWYVFWVNHWVL
jgi:hypothetical protein